jgi:hypothetical protein
VAQIAVNITGNSPDNSAMLDISSETSGILIPRVTLAQRNAFPNLATGLLVYQTDNNPGFYFYDGNDWVVIGSESIKINDLLDGKTTGNSLYLGLGAGASDNSLDNKNVGVGNGSLAVNTSGDFNAANGLQTLYYNTTGNRNTANGYRALFSNTIGTRNTATGFQSLYYNIDGEWNTAIGSGSLLENTAGNNNTAIGFLALNRNTIGNNNTAIGRSVSYYNQEGSNNTMIGYQAGMGTANHNKSGNVFLGFQAGYFDTTDNKLYIENSNSLTPLIWGDFANDILAVNGRIGIGTHTPHASAILALESNSKGFMPPGLTSVQRDAITTPAPGLFIFNSDINLYQIYTAAGWQSLSLESCVPSQPGTISGDEYPDCDETGVDYSVDPVTPATNYNWTIPSGATLTTGQGTTSITVDFGTTGGDVSVRAKNGCGNSEWTILPVTIGTPPIPDTIYGNPYPECNETSVAYSIDPIGGSDNYTWSVPAAASLISGQGTTSIIVDFATAGGDISVRAENNCGNSAYKILPIIMGIPVQPGSISGSSNPPCWEQGVSYNTPLIPGATNYHWTVTPGITIASGQGTRNITVNFGTTGGDISVRAENSCGNSAYTDYSVSVAAPGAPGTISGPIDVCPNAKGVEYSISPVVGASHYVWSVPTGATFTPISSHHGSAISVDFGADPGDILVSTANSCGIGGTNGIGVSMTCPLGSNFEGGLLFYEYSSGTTTWLVCTETDQSAGVEWGCYGTDISDAEEEGISFGESNTEYILQGCPQNEIAARVCTELSLNGYDDWFLPSRDQMAEMDLVLHQAGLGNFNAVHEESYWTSTQSASGLTALNYSFEYGGEDHIPKYSTIRVRCVRKIQSN